MPPSCSPDGPTLEISLCEHARKPLLSGGRTRNTDAGRRAEVATAKCVRLSPDIGTGVEVQADDRAGAAPHAEVVASTQAHTHTVRAGESGGRSGTNPLVKWTVPGTALRARSGVVVHSLAVVGPNPGAVAAITRTDEPAALLVRPDGYVA
jgi:hypothetical protein